MSEALLSYGMELAPGVVVGDRYRLDALIGLGGMGEVWAATHSLTDRQVALKFLDGDHTGKEQARQRFMREAKATGRVEHAHVVAVHDVLVIEDDRLVMVMDRLFGETLRDRLERDGALTLAETAATLVPVLSAVGTAHSVGIVHRDLKPENIFLTDDGDVKVVDFGIAKLMRTEGEGAQEQLTQTGAVLGTPHYMAPEQIFGERDVDARADVWSLGIILYECLSGDRPFEGANAGQVMKRILLGRYAPLPDDIDPRVVALVDEMLALDRQERPEDLQRAFGLLADFTDEVPVSFSPPRRSLAPSLPPSSVETLDSDSLRIRERLGPLSTPPVSAAAAARDRALMETAPSLDTVDAMATSRGAPPKTRRPWWLAAILTGGAVAALVAWPRDEAAPTPAAPPMVSAAPVVASGAPTPAVSTSSAAPAASTSSAAAPLAASPSTATTSTLAPKGPHAAPPKPRPAQPRPAAAETAPPAKDAGDEMPNEMAESAPF